MRVKIEYIGYINIEEKEIPCYITEDSAVYVGHEIMNFLKLKTHVKQCLIADINDTQ